MHPQSTQFPLVLEAEEWRPVVGYEGWYEVSSLGRVRRVRRGTNARIGHILRAQHARNGYLHATLCREGRTRQFAAHRLVAEAFLGPPAERHTNHKNGVKADNRADNLEWVTPSGNMRHAVAMGRQMSPPSECKARGERHGNAKLRDEDIRIIRAARGLRTNSELVHQFGVNRGTIRNIQHRRSWRHLP